MKMGITYKKLSKEVDKEVDRMIANGTFVYAVANNHWTTRENLRWNLGELRDLTDDENRLKILNSGGNSHLESDGVYRYLKMMLRLNNGGFVSPEEDIMDRLMARTMTEEEYSSILTRTIR